MICITNRCGQNSKRCSTPLTCSGASAETESAIHAARLAVAMNAPVIRDPITFAGEKPEEFTQGEALDKLTLCKLALYFVIGAAAVAAVLFIAVQLWPVIVGSL